MSKWLTHLGVFAKYWRPGRVKTRLAREIGEARAAALYRAFVETTLERLSGLAERHELCFCPADRREAFQEVVPQKWDLAPQSEGDLGDRMAAFFDRAFASGSSRVVLVGSDTPGIPRSFIEEAFERLGDAAVVLGPSLDGGYYLVGAREKTPPMFRRIAWSTPDVWQQTVAALAQSGLQWGAGYAVVSPWSDVDTLGDLQGLRRQLASDGPRDPSLSRLATLVDLVLKSMRE